MYILVNTFYFMVLYPSNYFHGCIIHGSDGMKLRVRQGVDTGTPSGRPWRLPANRWILYLNTSVPEDIAALFHMVAVHPLPALGLRAKRIFLTDFFALYPPERIVLKKGRLCNTE